MRGRTAGSACAPEYDDIIGGGTDSVSVPLGAPPVGEVRSPGVTTGSPLPTVRSVVQPNAAMDAQRETARSVRIAGRSAKSFVFSVLLM
jgi:hypothetical protein